MGRRQGVTDSDHPVGSKRGHWFEDLADTMGSAYLRYAFTRGTEQEAAFITGAMNLPEGAVVIDVGCGPGRHTRALAGRGLCVVGVDIAQRFLDVASQSDSSGAGGEGPLGYLRADAGCLPVATASVDAVVSLCQGAFGLPPVGSGDDTDGQILAEMARVVRPGGVVVLSAFSAYFQVRWLEDTDSFDAGLGRNHEHTTIHDPNGKATAAELWTSCYTPRELRLLAAAAGLRVEHLWSVAPGDYAARPPGLDHQEFLVVARR